ncbi:MAG: hypothetical protein U1E26_08135 [Coriobacteriia bacterium]|nr:hypothetical protein [Coriobacteriia bacterium]
MGLFGPPKEFRERTFTMPCSQAEAISVLRQIVIHDGSRPFGKPLDAYYADVEAGSPDAGKPRLVESIYVERLDSQGFVIAAGNRTATYWKVQLQLTGDNPVQGTFGAIEANDTFHWGLNVLGMVHALSTAVSKVGGSLGKWPR